MVTDNSAAGVCAFTWRTRLEYAPAVCAACLHGDAGRARAWNRSVDGPVRERAQRQVNSQHLAASIIASAWGTGREHSVVDFAARQHGEADRARARGRDLTWPVRGHKDRTRLVRDRRDVNGLFRSRAHRQVQTAQHGAACLRTVAKIVRPEQAAISHAAGHLLRAETRL